MNNDVVFDASDGRCDIDTYLFFRSEWSAMEMTYAVLDLEVTERMEADGEIMGIQAMLISPDGAKMSELELLVQTQRPVPDWLLQELKLHAGQLAASAIEDVAAMQALKDFVGGHPVFVHHASFDMPFLHQTAKRFGLQFSNQVFDTLAIAELTWPGRRCSHTGLRQLLQLSLPEDQRLSEDVMTTWQILLAARELAQTVHVKRIQAAWRTQLTSAPHASNGANFICPFCQISHPFHSSTL